MKNNIVIALLLVIYSCGGVSDFSMDLDDGYHFSSNGSDAKYVYYGQDDLIEKILIPPSIIDLDYNDKHIVCSQTSSRRGISFLVKEKLNGKFSHSRMLSNKNELNNSIYKNKVFTESDSLLVNRMIKKGFVGNNQAADMEIIKIMADSILYNDEEYQRLFQNEVNFWIIDKKKKLAFGPYESSEFVIKRKELNVSATLGESFSMKF
ncbi:hypothetical protein N9954_08740 [Maribacter sp.]|nr:hypothetical protein [Maribacter sp.]